MNIKIKLAYFSIVLSILSFTGILLGADIGAFIIFAIGCLTCSYLALYFFKKDGAESSSKAFLGGFIAMTIFLVIHVLFLIMTLTFRESDNWKWGWQFLLTMFGIIPAIIAGTILGGIFEIIERHFSTKIAYLVLVLILFTFSLFLIVKYQQNALEQKVGDLHRNGQKADGAYACDSLLHEDYQLIRCYAEEAAVTGSAKHCISGIERSLPGMTDCIFLAAKKSRNVTICDYYIDNPALERYLGYAPSYQDHQLKKQPQLIYVEDYKICLSGAEGKN